MGKRYVKAHLASDGIVIFQLLEASSKTRAKRVFGYGTNNKLWLRIKELASGESMFSAESASTVKEQISRWSKSSHRRDARPADKEGI